MEGAPQQGDPQQGAPQGVPQQDAPQQGAPQQAAPQGVPQQDAPQQGAPQQEAPQGAPQQDAPQQGAPQGVPPVPPLGPDLSESDVSDNEDPGAARAQPPRRGREQKAKAKDLEAELKQLEQLHAAQVISDAEYAASRCRVLNIPCAVQDNQGDKGVGSFLEAMAEANARTERHIQQALELRAASPSTPDEAVRKLADVIHEDQLAKLHKWRVVYAKAKLERESLLKFSPTTVEEAFLARCKDRTVTPEDAFYAFYAFYGSEAAWRFLRSLLAYTTDMQERIVMHNFWVAEHMDKEEGQAFIDVRGEKLAALRWPLFPPAAGYTALNLSILRDTKVDPVGGAAQPVPSAYAAVVQRRNPSGGDFWAPVQETASGYAVNLTPVEQHCDNMVSRIERLEQQTANRRNNYRRNNNNNNNSNNSNNNRNSGGNYNSNANFGGGANNRGNGANSSGSRGSGGRGGYNNRGNVRGAGEQQEEAAPQVLQQAQHF